MSSFEKSWERGSNPIAKSLLQTRLIGKIVRSQVPNTGLWPSLSQSTKPNSWCLDTWGHPFPSSFPATNCARLQHYRHFVGWAYDPTSHDCHSANYTVVYFFVSCPTHPKDLAPGNMWATSHQVAKLLADIPHFTDIPPFQIDFDSIPFWSPIPPGHLLLTQAPPPLARPLHLSSPHIQVTHILCGPEVRLSATQQQQQQHKTPHRPPLDEIHLPRQGQSHCVLCLSLTHFGGWMSGKVMIFIVMLWQVCSSIFTETIVE